MDVDYLLIADFAEAFNGKIYVQGGGWDTMTANSPFPLRRNVAIALGLRVPWEETNQRHTVRLVVLNEDRQAELAVAEGEVEVGRAPGIPPGQSQLVPVAFTIPLAFDAPAAFSVRLSLDGEEVKVVPFRVVAGPLSRMAEREA